MTPYSLISGWQYFEGPVLTQQLRSRRALQAELISGKTVESYWLVLVLLHQLELRLLYCGL
jgi:hypothetical protein